MSTGCSNCWRNGAEVMHPQPRVPKLRPPWKGHLQAGSFPISRARSSLRPGSAPGFWESQLPSELGCARAPALQSGMFLPAWARMCVSTSRRTYTPPLPPGPHLSSLSPRFGFYKYMKMDEEEEDPRQRAFLFLNPDSESPLPAGSFLGISHQLGMGLSTRHPRPPAHPLGDAAHRDASSDARGLEEGRPARSSLPPSGPACSVVTHPARFSHKALRGMGSGMLGLGFTLPAS